MHKHIVLSLVLLLFINMVALSSGAASGIDWHTYEDGLESARTQDKPVMIYFGAAWCSYCTMMKEDVFPDQRIIDASSDMIFIAEDTDVDTTIANMYGVTGLPTMIFLTPQGNEQFRSSGFRDVQDLLADISRSLQMYHGDRIDWVSYEDGRAEARRTETPLLLYFRDEGCTGCSRMDSETFSDPKILDISRDYIMVKIEASARPTLVQKYQVGSYPVVILADHDGTELERIQGFADDDQLHGEMEAILTADEGTEDSTPGFTSLMLLSALAVFVLIYGKVIYTNK